MVEIPTAPLSSAESRRADTATVLQHLDQIHRALRVGQTFPTRRQLMEQLGAPEHIVRGALDEFERQGKINRRPGRGGSTVADPSIQWAAADSQGNDPGSTPAPTLSSTIAVLTKSDSGFFDVALNQLQNSVMARDLTLTFYVTAPGAPQLPVWNERPRGVLVFSRDLYPLAEQLRETGHRVVLVGLPPDGITPTMPIVYGNRGFGEAAAANHLLEMGHRRLAFLAPKGWKGEGLSDAHERVLHEWRRNGHEISVEIVPHHRLDTWRHDPEQGKAFFERPDAPTALLGFNDTIALEFLAFLHYIGVRVPEAISLVGYDNLPASASSFPALTTVDAHLGQQLEMALDLILQKSPQTPAIVIVPSLVRRDSAVPPAPLQVP